MSKSTRAATKQRKREPQPKDWHDYILSDSPIITEESWRLRNESAAKYIPDAYDLMLFSDDQILGILIEVERDEKPRFVGYWGIPGDRRPIASYAPRRAWVEWHLFRGLKPSEKREPIGAGLRAMVIERDGYVCGICSLSVDHGDVHLDHIKPLSKGGPTMLANLRVTHSACNLQKGASWVEGCE